jgi:hypothetical protein
MSLRRGQFAVNAPAILTLSKCPHQTKLNSTTQGSKLRLTGTPRRKP